MTEAAALQPAGAWRERARGVLHRAAHGVLPLVLGLRRRLARSGYERLLAAYRLDFLRQRRAFPQGVPYTLLDAQPVAPGAVAYRLQAPAGVRHEPGDTLLVRWAHADDEVQALLDRLHWRGDEPLRLSSASSAFAPGRWVRTDARSALREIIDLRAALEAGALDGLAPGAQWSVDCLAGWPRQQPRSYSLTAIEHRPGGDIVELMVSELRTAAGQGGAAFGRCSGYLARLRSGDVLRAWPLDFPLTLHRPQADARAPLLVVATGIAVAGPLLELPQLPAPRPVWLLCGLRHADATLPLTRRLLAAAAARPGLRLDVALSRDAAPAAAAGVCWHGHCHVQDVLHAGADELLRLIDAGGDIVVIGHTGMGQAVQALLRSLFVARGRAADEAQAAALLRQLEHGLRVQYSLSGD